MEDRASNRQSRDPPSEAFEPASPPSKASSTRSHLRRRIPLGSLARSAWKSPLPPEPKEVKGRGDGQVPVEECPFPWQPVRSTKKMPLVHSVSSTRGRLPPKRWMLGAGAKWRPIEAQSSSLIVKRELVPGYILPPVSWVAGLDESNLLACLLYPPNLPRTPVFGLAAKSGAAGTLRFASTDRWRVQALPPHRAKPQSRATPLPVPLLRNP